MIVPSIAELERAFGSSAVSIAEVGLGRFLSLDRWPEGEVRSHHGQDALGYAEAHLRLVSGAGTYVVRYECPDCGKGWILDWVGAEPHGGMRPDQARLRTFAEVRTDAIAALHSASAIADDLEIQELIARLSDGLDALRTPPRYN